MMQQDTSRAPLNATADVAQRAQHPVAPDMFLVRSGRLGNQDLSKTASDLAQLAGTLVEVNAERSRFLSKVVHELRTPLTIAKGWVDMLRYDTLPPEQERVVQVVEQQISELTRLVDDLLDLSRRQADALDLRIEAIDCVKLVQQVVACQRELPSNQRVAFSVATSVDKAVAAVDRGRVIQVLNNLIANAVRYVDQDGRGVITLGVTMTETMVQLSVHDNGIGISAEHLPHICEPFYQVGGRAGGRSGLGLTVAYELVHAHRGFLTIESAERQGTTFHVWLRRVTEPEQRAERTTTPVTSGEQP
jgi:signal transduction histidine kinase